MTGLPLLLDLAGRRVVIVGGGPVAARRLRAVLDGGADDVVVITPERSAQLTAVLEDVDRGLGEPSAASGDRLGAAVQVIDRVFAPSDLDGAWLALACTDSPDVNTAVAAEARRRRLFAVRADAAGGGSARMPAVGRIGDITIGVNASDDPSRAAAVRDAIALAAQLGELPTTRRRPQRNTHEPAGAGSKGPARQGAPQMGRVALIGGGPGDPELITVRGRRLLAEAQVVVVDRLAPRALLAQLAPGVEVIDCGKSPHRHNMTQAQINAVIVARARAGLRVVRLKGGDPFVFGRGGEEVAACVAAGVPVEVVPGVTSALAGPASIGVPVTHRGVAADVTIVSGHLDPGSADDLTASGPDWSWLAAGPSTLILLMAMGRLEAIAAELVRRGRDPLTPCAVVQHATTDRERSVRAPLQTIAKAAADAGLGSPAVVVIGQVAALGAPDR